MSRAETIRLWRNAALGDKDAIKKLRKRLCIDESVLADVLHNYKHPPKRADNVREWR